jgi:hypothetical protein
LDHLLFAGYLVLFAWIVTKIPFFTRSGLTPAQLIIVFLLKVMAGIFYGWIGIYYGELAQMVDTWAFHYESLQEYELLKNEPNQFFTSLFNNTYAASYSGFLTSKNSWWNDLHGMLVIKIMALFNVLSFGNYFINVIFYSFLTLFGPIAFFRVMQDVYPAKKIVLLIATFFIPSFIYWTSGIHKDGLLFVGFALVTYHLYFSFKVKKIILYRFAFIALGVVLILGLRNFLIMNLVPAVLAWLLAERLAFKCKPVFTFIAMYILFVTLFFTAGYVSPHLNFPEAVVQKQQAFLALKGSSAIPIVQLQPTFASFLYNAPQSIALSIIRPYPTDVKHLLSMAAAVEITILLSFFLLILFWGNDKIILTPFLLFCIFFSFSVLMTIGYTVNFLGAIVRYRSIVLPFLFVPVAAQINWEKLGHFIFDMKNKNNY